MPGAKTHDAITVVTALAGDAFYLLRAPHPNALLAALFTGAYLFAGFACAGDLDLNSKEYQRWGPLRILWWPYRLLVPHRSWISHGLILGGVIRAGYLGLASTLVFWLAVWLYSRLGLHVDPNRATQQEWQDVFAFVHVHPTWSLALLSGFILAGTTHSLADLVSTWFKRHF